MTDSGNGAQLMYRIDLPATDGGLVQKCTNAFARASDDAVSIDTSVHNPARIWRIPGTMNCKGDSIPERPHRMAKLQEAPDNLLAVSEAQLLDVAAWDDTDSGYLGNHQISTWIPGSRSTAPSLALRSRGGGDESGSSPSARSTRRTPTSPPC